MSKFVTVVVEKKGEDEIGVECYMASDQCQTLERDNIFGNSTNPKKMVIRELGQGEEEALPAVLREGAPVKEFEPDFFLVSLAHGQPNDNNTKFNILKRYDFPTMHRFGKKQTPNDFKAFMQNSKGLKNKSERFACFQSLLYLAEMLDVDSALTVSRCVADERDVDPAMVELLESFM